MPTRTPAQYALVVPTVAVAAAAAAAAALSLPVWVCERLRVDAFEVTDGHQVLPR